MRIATAVLVSVQDEVFLVSLTETMVKFVEGEWEYTVDFLIVVGTTTLALSPKLEAVVPFFITWLVASFNWAWRRLCVHTYIDADIKMPALLAAVGMTAEVTGSHWLIRRNAKLAWKQSRSTSFWMVGLLVKGTWDQYVRSRSPWLAQRGKDWGSTLE